ncbi:MAG TPA: 23S rRNA (adenine(2503)-C(2))-methyltransferase RlmN [Pirellulaceae bacterium]|nr:23S rRNA (adenine(2503)-C(2))-methyltransferase RlmN [Pirellulaceae bacterium]
MNPREPSTSNLFSAADPKSLLAEISALPDWLAARGQPAFRAKQIVHWMFQGRADSFDQMSDLPASLRAELAQHFMLWSTTIVRHQRSEDGTEKLLLRLNDGGLIECVLLRDGDRRTVCVSSQVGCAMGCVFCASGLQGVDRNLADHEIVEQVLRLQRLLPANERLSHIVMMGMGEPLANVENVQSALKQAADPNYFGISARRITISTVGLPPAIRRLADAGCRYHLAISLHAPNDELRNQLVPVNRKIGIAELLEAADYFFEKTGRRLTFEYVLLAGVNDSTSQAEELGALLSGRTMLLNVIPYNPVAGLPYQTPSAAAILEFRRRVERYGITIKFRQRKGDQINAACGQLRREVMPTTP